jgi:hypothetical protein
MMSVLTVVALVAATPAKAPCIPQPLPSPLTVLGKMPDAVTDMIEFAASPSRVYPMQAWAIRVSRRSNWGATVEVLRLRGENDCNRFQIDQRWQVPLTQADYSSFAAEVAPLATPSSDAFVPPQKRGDRVTMDGTGIELRLTSQQWQVTRSLNYYAGGAAISAIFHRIIEHIVPSDQQPTAAWQPTGSPD